jgi:N-acetyltransferase
VDLLSRSHWGGRYNREMKHLLLRHAFRFVKRVIFLISPQNVRSQKALEKLGAIRVGSRLDAAGRDSYLYEMTSLPLMEPGLKGNTHRNSDLQISRSS